MSAPGPCSLPGDKRNDNMEVVQLPHKSSCSCININNIRAVTGLHVSQISKIIYHNVSMQILKLKPELEFPV